MSQRWAGKLARSAGTHVLTTVTHRRCPGPPRPPRREPSAPSDALLRLADRPAAGTARPLGPKAAHDQGNGPGTPSGSDASCPPTTPAAAGSATPTAPTEVRAIGGDGSATVVWCPPASGAGSVVSYTVDLLGRPAGHRRRAQRLGHRGRPHRRDQLHLHGHGQHRQRPGQPRRHLERRSPRLRSPPPRHVLLGQPQQVSYDQYSMSIGGQRVYITAGRVRPVAHAVAVAVAGRPAEDEGRRLQRGDRLLRLGLLLAVPGRLRLHRRQGHERVPEHGPAGGPLRDRPARPVHQRRDRRRRHPVLGR